jgi:hypothetical protein
LPAKGEFEVIYGNPWAGVDYSKPANLLDPNSLAPGTMNTSQVNGYLTSAPWLANHPFAYVFQAGEYPIGFFPYTYQATSGQNGTIAVIVTNLGVYTSGQLPTQGNVTSKPITINSLYVWQPTDLIPQYMLPNNAVTFVEINNQVFFTGLMLAGVYYIYFGQVVTGLTLTNPGSGYSHASVGFTLGGGSGAAASATIGTSGVVSSVLPVHYGFGYTHATVNFSGGGGSGAAATPQFAPDGIPDQTTFKIIGYHVTSGGSGYTSPPSVTITGDGFAATAQAYISASGAVVGLVLTNPGNGYTSAPTVTITGDGSNATATATIGPGIPPVPAFGQATSYVSGAYMIELGGRLVIGQCQFPTGGGTGTQVSPTIAWSGVGAYVGSGSTDPWNPANFNALSGNVGGFQPLADVPDQITGLCAIGRSGIIGRTNGISQMDPGLSGTAPFTFYHLWSSIQGVGARPNTMVQWGMQVLFLSSDNVYSLSISGGIQPIGQKIMPRINNDQRNAAGFPTPANGSTNGYVGYWHYASLVSIQGQLHYLLTFSCPLRTGSTNTSPLCFVYDFNVAEQSWHIWDLSQYYIATTPNAQSVALFSCPILAMRPVIQVLLTGGTTNLISPLIFLVGTIPQGSATNQPVMMFVPLDYGPDSDPTQTFFTSSLFVPQALPATTIKTRAEIVSLGHRVTGRRLRIQSDNPNLPSGASPPAYPQQKAQIVFAGTQNTSSSPNVNIPTAPTNGALHMQTWYGDSTLSEEMVQATINPVVDPAVPWQNMPMFRISTISLVGVDTKGTQN